MEFLRLTKDEIRSLAQRMETAEGDERIRLRNRIVESHLGLVHGVAWKYRKVLAYDDTFQVLSMWLIRCVDKYDWRRGPLTPYAKRYVEGVAKNELRRLATRRQQESTRDAFEADLIEEETTRDPHRRRRIKELFSGLNDREQQIVIGLLKEEINVEIGHRIGLGEYSALLHKQRLRKRLRESEEWADVLEK